MYILWIGEQLVIGRTKCYFFGKPRRYDEKMLSCKLNHKYLIHYISLSSVYIANDVCILSLILKLLLLKILSSINQYWTTIQENLLVFFCLLFFKWCIYHLILNCIEFYSGGFLRIQLCCFNEALSIIFIRKVNNIYHESFCQFIGLQQR